MFNLSEMFPTRTILDIFKPATKVSPLDFQTDTAEDGTITFTVDTSKIEPDVKIEVSDNEVAITLKEENTISSVEHSFSFRVDGLDKENVSAEFDEDGKLVVTLPVAETGNKEEEKEPSITINRI